MSKTAAPKSASPIDADDVRQQLAGKHVCPFCGVMRADPAQPCPRCTLDDNPATRAATRVRIGPWFVLQARNPSAPGMRLATLQSLIRKGHVTPRSVVRGPTTEQMWAFAANVRGLSREFGLCYHCGEAIDALAATCPHCKKGQELPADVDSLLETAPLPTPAPAPQPPVAHEPIIRHDFLSDSIINRAADTGMDGGTSLDLQADSAIFALSDTRPTPPVTRPAPAARPAPVPQPAALAPIAAPSQAEARQIVQRATVPAKDDAILTARELAAAFQLDFKTPNSRGQAAGLPGGPRERRPVRTLAAVLLVLAVAATIVLSLRRDWRETSWAWLSEQWSHVAASLEQPAKPAAKSDPSAAKPPAVSSDANKSKSTPAVTAQTPPAISPTVLANPPANTAPPTPVTPPAEPAKVPPVAEAKPEPKSEQKPEPAQPVAVTPPPKIETPTPEIPADVSIEQATVIASDLRLKAIDAQAKNDWAAALKCYEQIQKLPPDAWPADLNLRLELARKRVEKSN